MFHYHFTSNSGVAAFGSLVVVVVGGGGGGGGACFWSYCTTIVGL